MSIRHWLSGLAGRIPAIDDSIYDRLALYGCLLVIAALPMLIAALLSVPYAWLATGATAALGMVFLLISFMEPTSNP